MAQEEKIKTALEERIKELNCLYGMVRLAEKHHDSMTEFLNNFVNFLPLSWRYAEVARARIVFQETIFESKGFVWTEWKQSAQIRVGNKVVGDVSVIYADERPESDEGPFLKEERTLLEGVAQRIAEISVRLLAEQELQENNRQLSLERKALQEANIALRVVLSNIENEKKQIYEDIKLNVKSVILPILDALTPAISREKRPYVELLKTNLEELGSSFSSQVSNHLRSLTPTEVNICNMIRNGLRTKEIALLRGVSTDTINRHREHIRRKLHITNQKINLIAYLQSLVVLSSLK